MEVVEGKAAPDYAALGAAQAKIDFGSASAGGAWEFDPDAMDSVIRYLEDVIRNDILRLERDAGYVTGIDPPGHELVSESYVADANRSGESWKGVFEQNRTFLTAYIDTLKEVRDAYSRQDEAALEALRGKAGDAS
ncbi:hypothetical protein [Amycolatopsis arida]|uniref:hypothetical protein n=1 Tax=Amycolatopsis arida TaxID=587909 RepID=UPI001065A965|nr:hypothetical protein [Amycolatopsis arida]